MNPKALEIPRNVSNAMTAHTKMLVAGTGTEPTAAELTASTSASRFPQYAGDFHRRPASIVEPEAA
jgi:hypothetical protein